MKLTTKGRYAVNAMLDLALNGDQGPVKLVHISDRQGISLSYLEQLFARLRRNKLVTSFRGPGGGYQLGRAHHQISIADVIRAVNESMDATRCKGQGDCQQGETCLTHHLWMDLSAQLEDFLHSISLADLVRRHHQRSVTETAANDGDTGASSEPHQAQQPGSNSQQN
jgi:Rrf2 family iron-sulfur cluster assembly transcriptional regulator